MEHPVMSDEQTPGGSKSKKVRTFHPDTVKVNPDALKCIHGWQAQIEKSLRGVKVTRRDLVNFILLSHEEELSISELQQLEKKHFDEVKFAQWATEELKAAKLRGEDLSLVDIIVNARPAEPAPHSRKRKPAVNKTTENADKSAQKESHTVIQASHVSLENSGE